MHITGYQTCWCSDTTNCHYLSIIVWNKYLARCSMACGQVSSFSIIGQTLFDSSCSRICSLPVVWKNSLIASMATLRGSGQAGRVTCTYVIQHPHVHRFSPKILDECLANAQITLNYHKVRVYVHKVGLSVGYTCRASCVPLLCLFVVLLLCFYFYPWPHKVTIH